jgi:hypothetical protein
VKPRIAILKRLKIQGEKEPRLGSTKNPHEPHEISTMLRPARQYPELVMKGSFVVQLWNIGQGMAGQLEGFVEEVDTGRQYRFRSEFELIDFLREQARQSLLRKDETR